MNGAGFKLAFIIGNEISSKNILHTNTHTQIHLGNGVMVNV